MKKIIKLLSLIWAPLLLSTCFCACANRQKSENEKIKVVCTVFPIYDWTREITGDKAELTWLISNGTDMNSFQPSAADMIRIA